MSKLLARAKVKLVNAENDYLRLGEDDAFLDDCCYNLEQAIELGLKYLVEMNGENYVENHDIRAQVNKLKTMNVELPFFEQVRSLASTINSWEADSRYNDNFVALMEDVEDARNLAREIIAYCEKLVEVVPEC